MVLMTPITTIFSPEPFLNGLMSVGQMQQVGQRPSENVVSKYRDVTINSDNFQKQISQQTKKLSEFPFVWGLVRHYTIFPTNFSFKTRLENNGAREEVSDHGALSHGEWPSSHLQAPQVPQVNCVWCLQEVWLEGDIPEEGTWAQKWQDQDSQVCGWPEKVLGDQPWNPMSKLAQNHGVHRTTICKAIKEDLGFKSFKLRCRHLLTTEQKENRVIKGKAMLSSLKATPRHIRFFSDEKLFTLDRSWTDPITRMTGGSARNLLWCPLSSSPRSLLPAWSWGSSHLRGMSCHPTSSPRAWKATKVLQEVVVPWMKAVAGDRRYTFQQDSAPAHKTKVVQSWLLGNVPHFWPVAV